MKTKLFKAYKFHNDVILGSYIGAIAFVLMALYEYYSYVHLGAKANSFFDVSSFSSIFFPSMMMTFLKEKKNLLMAHGFTRKKIFISQQFSMLSIIPFLSIVVIIVEKIYYQANGYKPFIQVLYEQYFKANNIQQWGAIAFTILWVATTIILMFAILYMIVEIAGILGKKGKIIFFVSLCLGFIALLFLAAFLYSNYGDFIRKVFGFGGNPIHSSITKIIVSIPFYITSYMIARRSPMKTK